MKPILCKNCNKMLLKAQVFVGEIKCKCGHTAEYRLLSDTFIEAVQSGEAFVHRAEQVEINRKTIALV